MTGPTCWWWDVRCETHPIRPPRCAGCWRPPVWGSGSVRARGVRIAFLFFVLSTGFSTGVAAAQTSTPQDLARAFAESWAQPEADELLPLLHPDGVMLSLARIRERMGRSRSPCCARRSARGSGRCQCEHRARRRGGRRPEKSLHGAPLGERAGRDLGTDAAHGVCRVRSRRRRVVGSRDPHPRLTEEKRRHPMALKLHNSMTRRLEPFEPQDPERRAGLWLWSHDLQLCAHREFPDVRCL